MSNENGDIIPMDHMPNWPKDMLATLHFEEASESKTKLIFLWELLNPKPREVKAFENSLPQHSGGWGQAWISWLFICRHYKTLDLL